MMKLLLDKYGTAERRWAGIGPYYAMFPTSFAERVIKRYSQPGDLILDPFAGRGTAVYAAAMHGRHGFGIEINPVGWVYAKAKLHTAECADVIERVNEIYVLSDRWQKKVDEMPLFFQRCFCRRVLRFLLAARASLDWRYNKVDWTLAALLLVHLHGKRTDSFSNQMRQAKSLSPKYAIDWWKENEHTPPVIGPLKFLRKKLDWRYAKGVPTLTDCQVYLGDSVNRLATVQTNLGLFGTGKVQLLLTSPPYCGVTNYHYDQWLRLWLLGGPAAPTAPTGAHTGKFVDRKKYRQLLLRVFSRCKPLLRNDATIYVRTDRRSITLDTTVEVLEEVFPKKRMRKYRRPRGAATQTLLFNERSDDSDDEDVDIILRS